MPSDSLFQSSGICLPIQHWQLSLTSNLNFTCNYLLVPAQWTWREALTCYKSSLNLPRHWYFLGSRSILGCVLASLHLLPGSPKCSIWAGHSARERRLYQCGTEQKDYFICLAEDTFRWPGVSFSQVHNIVYSSSVYDASKPQILFWRTDT